MIGDSNNETNFSNKLLLPDKQILSLPKAFAKNSSANIKLSETQLSKTVQSERFLDRILGPLLKTALLLLKNVLKLLAENVLISLGLTAIASAANSGIQNKAVGFGMTTLII